MYDFETFLKEQDELIKLGQGQKVQLSLKKLLHKVQIPREFRWRIAYIARRVGMSYTSLRILHSVLRPEKPLREPASDKERLQYAAALISIGVTFEAKKLLEENDAHAEPETLLYKAFSCFTHWDYQSSLPYLEKFISSPHISDYQKLMGKINLASALVSTNQFQSAQALSQEIFIETKEKNLVLLNAYSLEIRSEAELWLGDYKKSFQSLKEAESALEKTGVIGSLWVKKWQAVCWLFENKKEAGLGLLDSTKKLALQQGDWETVRDCDLFTSLFNKDNELYYSIYFGTPFKGYRKRIRDIFHANGIYFPIPPSYELTLKAGDKKIILDPRQLPKNIFLKPGQLEHKLLILLTEDLYKPVRIAQLHEGLYKNQYFNPVTSPRKIHELVRRSRRPLEKLGLQIESHKSGYKLLAQKPLALKMKLELPDDLSREDILLNQFLNQLSNPTFQRKDLEKILQISPRTAQRIISWALDKQKIFFQGKGKGITYQFKKSA